MIKDDKNEDEMLGLTQLFSKNRHITVPADVRTKLNILNEGIFKFLWLFDKNTKQVYIKVSKPTSGSYDTTPYP